MTHIAKVIEIIGSSDKDWEDAAQVAINEARKTLSKFDMISRRNKHLTDDLSCARRPTHSQD